jgi:DNA-binding transcriptional regulator YdaS (Cro superfamily)
MLSTELRTAIKISRLRQYQIAHLIGVHPTTLSAWINGISRVDHDDPRVAKLADLVGVPRECGRQR